MERLSRRLRAWALLLLPLLLPTPAAAAIAAAPAAAPTAAGGPPARHVITIRTAQGSFRAATSDPAVVEQARRELAGQGDAGVPTGALAWGNGGVNLGHRWHVTELTFADVTIELCDGTVRMVDRDPRYWVETVGSFCPWSGRVVSVRPLRGR